MKYFIPSTIVDLIMVSAKGKICKVKKLYFLSLSKTNTKLLLMLTGPGKYYAKNN